MYIRRILYHAPGSEIRPQLKSALMTSVAGGDHSSLCFTKTFVMIHCDCLHTMRCFSAVEINMIRFTSNRVHAVQVCYPMRHTHLNPGKLEQMQAADGRRLEPVTMLPLSRDSVKVLSTRVERGNGSFARHVLAKALSRFPSQV